MSTNHYVYVGPYLKTNEVELTLPKRTPAQCSQNPRHMQSGSSRHALPSAKFCADCGAPITPEKSELVTSHQYVNPHDVGDEAHYVDEMVTGGDYDAIWLPNHGGFGTTYSEFNGAAADELRPELMQVAKDKLLARYKPFMDYMQKRFPGLTYEVKFGVIAYYN